MNNDVTMERLVDALQGPHWRLPKSLVHSLGINPTLWLMDIFSKWKYFVQKGMVDKDGWFYNTQTKIEEDTTLSPFQQSAIIKDLQNKGILKVKKRGIPNKNYYQISINQCLRNLGTGGQETNALNNKNKENKNKEKKKTSLNREVLDELDSSSPSTSPSSSPLRKRKPLGIDAAKEEVKKTPEKENGFLDYDDASMEAREVVAHWNAERVSTTHGLTTKIVRRTLWLLENQLLKKYGKAVITRTISDYHTMLQNKQYRVPGRKSSLLDFFEMNDFLKQQRRKAGHSTETWFKSLYKSGSCRQFLLVDGDNLELADEIKGGFEKRVLGEKPEGGYNAKQERDFLECSNRLKSFIKRGRMEKNVMGMEDRDYVRLLLDALDDCFGSKKLATGNLSSDFTFNTVLPRYVKENYESMKEEPEFETIPEDEQ